MQLRWPDAVPGRATSTWALLAATYAKWIGRGVAFSLAALRQAFAAGRDLSEPDNVLIAAAACEMHPTAVVKGVVAGEHARARWTRPTRAPRPTASTAVPAIWIDGHVLAGERAIPA